MSRIQDVQSARPDFHPEIQGLRALAVMLVVLFHLWPNRLPAGFVGVDVFFVISGYLITSHMHREIVASGSLSLRRFWARRIRRLLPASLLVLAVAMATVLVFVPITQWPETARQVAASALYIQNWALVADSVDYMAQDNIPTAVQHYWSLSVEEQFYVVWPLLILAVIAFARRRPAGTSDGYRSQLFVALAIVAAVSFVYSVVATAADQQVAYFSSTTRIWEFAAGALLALAGSRAHLSGVAAGVAGWAGFVAIVVASLIFDGGSLFPGWIAALPVLGAVAVMAAGSSSSPLSVSRWFSARPALFIGDISYSVYLWHWPLVVIVPFITGVDLRTTDKVLILGATLVLAWLSKILVEDPMRGTRVLTKAPWRSFAFAATAMAVLLVGAAATSAVVTHRVAEAKAQTNKVLSGSLVKGCVGPAALNGDNDCESVEGTGDILPPPEAVDDPEGRRLFADCKTPLGSDKIFGCTLGTDSKNPSRSIAVVGDSHATHWLATFDALGKALNWKVETFTKSSCPMSLADRTLPGEQGDAEQNQCRRWVDAVRHSIDSDPSISQVYVSAFSSAYGWSSPADRDLQDPAVDGFRELWDSWAAEGKDVLVVRDTPRTSGDDMPTCVSTHDSNRRDCGLRRSEALPPDALVTAAEGADRTRVLDLTDQFCDTKWCYPVVGNLLVYQDSSHLSTAYAKALRPYLQAQITS